LTRASTIFSQILQLIPRLEFESVVRQHQAGWRASGFNSWGQNRFVRLRLVSRVCTYAGLTYGAI
jgi:hypothetical protein